MRASFKPFFLGILFTSITWSLVLYFYVSLDSKNISTPKYSASHQTTQEQAKVPRQSVISNFLEEAVEHDVEKSIGNTINKFGADLGLVRNSADQKIREEGYSHHAFNVLVSSRLDYHRAIPDSRHKLLVSLSCLLVCHVLKFDDFQLIGAGHKSILVCI